MYKIIERVKHVLLWLVMVVIFAVFSVLAINLIVIGSAVERIYTVQTIENQTLMTDDSVPILVLGAGIIDESTPSMILQLRLDKALELSKNSPYHPLLMSGDHTDDYYNEVAVMKKYAMANGVESANIYLDHAGYSTYDSLYRLKAVFKQEKVIIVTQGYHLSRALWIAKSLGLEAIGVAAAETSSTRWEREWREVFARIKDFSVVIFNYPKQTPLMTDEIDFSQSGDLTNEKKKNY